MAVISWILETIYHRTHSADFYFQMWPNNAAPFVVQRTFCGSHRKRGMKRKGRKQRIKWEWKKHYTKITFITTILSFSHPPSSIFISIAPLFSCFFFNIPHIPPSNWRLETRFYKIFLLFIIIVQVDLNGIRVVVRYMCTYTTLPKNPKWKHCEYVLLHGSAWLKGEYVWPELLGRIFHKRGVLATTLDLHMQTPFCLCEILYPKRER